MREQMKLYCGVDLHSRSGVYTVINEADRKVFRKRIGNDLATVLQELGVREILGPSCFWLASPYLSHKV